MTQELNELFISLGLTEYEAKCLSILTNLGEAKAPEISRLTQVPQTRVYDVLEKLAEKELIIEIKERPKKYKAIELEKTIEKLIEEKKREIQELEEKAKNIQEKLKTKTKTEQTKVEKIIKVKSLNDFAKILAEEINTAKNSIEGFSNAAIMLPHVKKTLNEAIKRNVKVRLIQNQFNSAAASIKGIETKKQQHDSEMLIIDDKKVILTLNDLKETNPEYNFSILYKEPIVKAIKNHFLENWEKIK